MAAPAPTDAERALSELFESRAAAFTAAPADEQRTEAFRRFAAAGLPHRRIEAYKYTDLRARLRTLPPAASAPSDADIDAVLAAHPPLVEGAHRIVLANGRLVAGRSSVPAGVRLASILSLEADTSRVGTLVADSDDPLTLANVALFDGGVVLHVDAKAEAPVEIVHVATEDALIMGRFAVFVEGGADATIIERFIGRAQALNNALAEVTLADEAHLSMVRISHGQDEASTTLSTHHLHLGKHAKLDHLTLSTGLGLARNQGFCGIHGDEAEANFRTAVVAIGKRHSDTTLVMRHNALHSNSSEIFRSAVGEEGKSIVQGRINVDPGAQKTDASMMSNALFLDDTGEVVNKPELEIFADDVVCGHGATSGDLDEEPIFYLRTRGIPEEVARRLLVEAFLLETLDDIEDGALADALADILRGAIGAPLGAGD